MKHTKLIAAVLILMLSTVFAMSGDGGQQPVKSEKKTEDVQIQSEQVQPVEKSVQETQHAQAAQPVETVSGEENKSDVRVTFKDEFGVETGMTKEELEKFKEDYMKRFKTNALFNAKIDPNKFKELKQLGVDFSKFGVITNYLYQNNTLLSDVIIIGKTVKRDKNFNNRHFLEIEEVLKGDEILLNKFGKIPAGVYYVYGDGGAGFTDPVIGERGLYFFVAAYALSKERPYLQRKAESTTILNIGDNLALHEDLYGIDKNRIESFKKQAEEGNKSSPYILESFDEVIVKIKMIVEVNDHKNFYKKSFKLGGKK